MPKKSKTPDSRVAKRLKEFTTKPTMPDLSLFGKGHRLNDPASWPHLPCGCDCPFIFQAISDVIEDMDMRIKRLQARIGDMEAF